MWTNWDLPLSTFDTITTFIKLDTLYSKQCGAPWIQGVIKTDESKLLWKSDISIPPCSMYNSHQLIFYLKKIKID